jgi:hypothetical protein
VSSDYVYVMKFDGDDTRPETDQRQSRRAALALSVVGSWRGAGSPQASHRVR